VGIDPGTNADYRVVILADFDGALKNSRG